MLLAIVYILLKSVSCPYILFMGLIFLVPLSTASHTFLQGLPHLVYFIGVGECWYGMVNTPGPSMIPEVAL